MATTSIFTDHASTYAAMSEQNPVNRAYDRPTILRLLGDIEGRRVLELGCAAGGLTAHLVQRGADVISVDAEPRMIDIARRKLGTSARFELVDLEQPLTIVEPGSVDVVAASLVLHYVKDWAPLLRDIHRCLVPGGALVFSMHHPVTAWVLSDQTDYHRVELVSEDWDWGGLAVTARSYRRPLSAVFGGLREAGFAIDAVEEPRIAADAGIDPELLHVINTQPLFLFVRAIAGA